MINCARCGQQVSPGTAMCPRCGSPLGSPRPGTSFADENVPEWMRAVQGGQPNPPMDVPAGPGSLSVGSLLSDDAVPEWLRTAADVGAPLPASPDPWRSPQTPAPGAWSPPPPGPVAGGWSPPPTPPASAALGYGPGYAAPAGATPSAAGLFNESALPDWLREASAGQPPLAAQHLDSPGPFVSGLAPSAAPGPATPYPPRAYGAPASPSQYPGSGQPGGNLAANALFDAGALPTWLGGAGNFGQPPRPATPLGGDGLQMSSLVDERALPMWLRQEPETPPAQTPMPGSVSRWLSAPVTEEPMPPFLNQVYDAAQVARAQIPASPPSYWGAAAPSAPPMPGAVPSANLLDDTALPQWLRAQADGAGAHQPPSGPPNAAYQPPSAFGVAAPHGAPANWGGYGGAPGMDSPSAQPATNFSAPGDSFAASDLIDPGAVPAWVQQGTSPSPQAEFSSTMGWTDHTAAIPPMPATGSHQGMAMNPGWAASAMGGPSESASLPSWLQAPNAVAGPAASGAWTSAHAGVRRQREASIPPAELPPWLQNGSANQPPTARHSPSQPQSGSTDEQWDELQRGWDDDDGGHYLDRFGAEEPDPSRPFGLEYDQRARAAEGGPRDFTGEQGANPPESGKGKRKRRGR